MDELFTLTLTSDELGYIHNAVKFFAEYGGEFGWATTDDEGNPMSEVSEHIRQMIADVKNLGSI